MIAIICSENLCRSCLPSAIRNLTVLWTSYIARRYLVYKCVSCISFSFFLCKGMFCRALILYRRELSIRVFLDLLMQLTTCSQESISTAVRDRKVICQA